ncbi:unnamed protein product [Amaranthus hypochondriacus]
MSDSISSDSGSKFKKLKTEEASSEISKFVTIKFINQENEETFMKVSRTMMLGKVLDGYCQHKQLKEQIDFIYNGYRINRSLTAEQVGLQDGDEIEVLAKVYGGGLPHCCC